MLKTLQDNLAYYQRQKQEIINNQQNYISIREHREYGAWQSTSYTFSYNDILAIHGASAYHGSPCFYPQFWRRGRYGQHMNDNSTTQEVIRNTIAHKLARPLDEISQNLIISARGEDPTYQFGELAYFNTYTIGYQHRKLHIRQERYFDQERYNQTLRECEQNIESSRVAIINFQEQQILEEKIGSLHGQISNTKSQITKNQMEASNHSARINAEIIKRQDYERKYAQVQAGNNQVKEKLKSRQDDIYNMLHSADEKQRAFFLSELCGNADSATIISTIKSLGFDASELAYLAILNNHNELFELAIQYGAGCANYMVEGKTLLQHLIQQNKDDLIRKVLEAEKDIACTLITAVGQNDAVTIDKLHSLNSNFLKQKFAGYTLLQIAISLENPEIEMIKKLLALDNTLIAVLNNNGESALKIAVRLGNEDIIEIVKQSIDLKVEVEQLKLDTLLKDEILARNDIDEVIRLFQEENQLNSINGIVADYEGAEEAVQENEIFNEWEQEYSVDIQGLSLDASYI